MEADDEMTRARCETVELQPGLRDEIVRMNTPLFPHQNEVNRTRLKRAFTVLVSGIVLDGEHCRGNLSIWRELDPSCLARVECTKGRWSWLSPFAPRRSREYVASLAPTNPKTCCVALDVRALLYGYLVSAAVVRLDAH